MRRIIYDRRGEPILYLTGGGAMYAMNNQPVGRVQDEQVVGYRGQTLGWFDGQFLWDTRGKLLGFVKGAKGSSLSLPKTRPLTVKPAPTPAPFHPLLEPAEKPELEWVWSEKSLEMLVGGERV